MDTPLSPALISADQAARSHATAATPTPCPNPNSQERQLFKLQALTRQLLAENGLSANDCMVAFRQLDEDGTGLVEPPEFSRFIYDVLGLSLDRTELNQVPHLLYTVSSFPSPSLPFPESPFPLSTTSCGTPSTLMEVAPSTTSNFTRCFSRTRSSTRRWNRAWTRRFTHLLTHLLTHLPTHLLSYSACHQQDEPCRVQQGARERRRAAVRREVCSPILHC